MSHVSQRRQELFVYMGAAFATAGALFAAQILYGSFIDQQYHATLKEAGPYQAVLDKREGGNKTLESGKIPLEAAKQLIVQKGRAGISSIIPTRSEDLSPLSGWIQHPAFKPVVAHPIRVPRA